MRKAADAFWDVRRDSLNNRTGNCWSENRATILENREFSSIQGERVPPLSSQMTQRCLNSCHTPWKREGVGTHSLLGRPFGSRPRRCSPSRERACPKAMAAAHLGLPACRGDSRTRQPRCVFQPSSKASSKASSPTPDQGRQDSASQGRVGTYSETRRADTRTENSPCERSRQFTTSAATDAGSCRGKAGARSGATAQA
jgi:hypothetical protein